MFVCIDFTDVFTRFIKIQHHQFVEYEEMESLPFQEDQVEKLHQLGGEFCEVKDAVAGEVALPLVFSFVPWRHHVDIITQCKNIDEALFYIRKTIDEGWGRQTIDNCFMPSCIKVKVEPSLTLRIICSRNRVVWHRKSPRIPMFLD